ncbi:hypothetical protein PLIP_a2291 [Pseudoalteromonas lipolytica LMEB 39]|nr:hypothetical protein [Pseudoalteromonas lipolytica LMEB 39]
MNNKTGVILYIWNYAYLILSDEVVMLHQPKSLKTLHFESIKELT